MGINFLLSDEDQESNIVSFEKDAIRARQMEIFKEIGIAINESNLEEHIKYIKDLLFQEDLMVRLVLECIFSLNGELFTTYGGILSEIKKRLKAIKTPNEKEEESKKDDNVDTESDDKIDESLPKVTFGDIYKYRTIGIRNIKSKIEQRQDLISKKLPNLPLYFGI